MKKIRITEEQYKKIIISEGNRKNDNFKNVFFGIAKLIGIDLTGQNEIMATNALNNKEIMADIKSTFEDDNKLKEIITTFEEKDEKDAKNKIVNNIDEIIKKFNDYSKKLDMSIKLGIITKQIVNTL